jgi:hypothetical protein
MAEATSGAWGWAKRWPRYVGAILLAAAAQSGIGAWAVSSAADATPLRLQLAAYLAGCAVVAGVIGLVLCIVPLPIGQSDPQERRVA